MDDPETNRFWGYVRVEGNLPTAQIRCVVRSLPTATALLSCRYASNCSAAQRGLLLRQHHRPQIRLIHSGTAQSAAVPCASLNGSLLPNSCFAPHLNQNGALHEPLSTSSLFARASARTRMPCLIRPKTLRYQPLQRPNQASKSHGPPPFGLQANRLHQTPPVRDPSAPTRADSKYIGFPVGGFLQAAVSGAPLSEHANPSCFAGRSRYSTKTSRHLAGWSPFRASDLGSAVALRAQYSSSAI